MGRPLRRAWPRWSLLALLVPVLATAAVSVAYVRSALAQHQAIRMAAEEFGRVVLRDGSLRFTEAINLGTLAMLRRAREAILATESPAVTPLEVAAAMWQAHDSLAACRCGALTRLRAIHVVDRGTGIAATLPATAASAKRATLEAALAVAESRPGAGIPVAEGEGEDARVGIRYLLGGSRGRVLVVQLEYAPEALAPLAREAFEGALRQGRQFRGHDTTATTIGFLVSLPDGPPILQERFTPGVLTAATGFLIDPLTGRAFNSELSIPETELGILVPGGMPGSPWPLVIASLVLSAFLAGLTLVSLWRVHRLAMLREEFVSGITHEIRTPLTQILLYGETLQLERPTPEARERAAAVIVREARRLSRLVENALAFVRGRRPEVGLEWTRFDLGEAVREATLSVASLAAAHGARVELAVEADLPVELDRGSVDQVVGNLLENAIRHGPDGQRIGVEVRRDGAMVLLGVSDEGPGVPLAERDRIWQPFVRAGPGAGAGLGLSIVRQLVELQGGSVRVDHGDHCGARFEVRWPHVAGAAPGPG